MTTTSPTQVVHPWRASFRTSLSVFLAVAGVAVLALPIVSEFVEQFWPTSPVIGFIATAAAFIAALALVVTRIMALEKVNELLTRFGLGAGPKTDDLANAAQPGSDAAQPAAE
jgi:hypothetical protein